MMTLTPDRADRAEAVIIMDQDKRQLRQLKREIKRAGSKHRRRQLKRDLAENPDEAHHSEESFGRNRSEGMNDMDADATRRHGKAP
jgi:hypothetical protein